MCLGYQRRCQRRKKVFLMKGTQGKRSHWILLNWNLVGKVDADKLSGKLIWGQNWENGKDVKNGCAGCVYLQYIQMAEKCFQHSRDEFFYFIVFTVLLRYNLSTKNILYKNLFYGIQFYEFWQCYIFTKPPPQLRYWTDKMIQGIPFSAFVVDPPASPFLHHTITYLPCFILSLLFFYPRISCKWNHIIYIESTMFKIFSQPVLSMFPIFYLLSDQPSV